MNGHLYSSLLKTCADGGTAELLDLGMAVYHHLHCAWDSRQGSRAGGVMGAEEQACAQKPQIGINWQSSHKPARCIQQQAYWGV